MSQKDPRKNQEKYMDLTAYAAIRSIDEEYAEFRKMLNTLKYICELSGFEIQGRIVFMNKKSKRVWR